MIKKIKLFKKVLEISKEVKCILKTNENDIRKLKQWLDTGRELFPSFVRLLDEMVEITKSNNNKKN